MKYARAIGFVLLSLLFVAWACGFFLDNPPALTDTSQLNLHPNAEHLLGTDIHGRDVFTRMILGTQAFVGPGILACLTALLIGLPLAAIAGWKGGITADFIRFIFTVFATFPRFVLVLLVCAIYGNTPTNLGLAAGLAYAPALGEAVFARVTEFRSAGFVLAAKAHGLSTLRILGFHILWLNARRLVFRHLVQLFAFFLIVETTLSCLGGFGTQEPNPSWGNMIASEEHNDDTLTLVKPRLETLAPHKKSTVAGFSEDAFQITMPQVNAYNPWAAWGPLGAIWITLLGCLLVAETLEERRDA